VHPALPREDEAPRAASIFSSSYLRLGESQGARRFVRVRVCVCVRVSVCVCVCVCCGTFNEYLIKSLLLGFVA
jgi:hypothetical protein